MMKREKEDSSEGCNEEDREKWPTRGMEGEGEKERLHFSLLLIISSRNGRQDSRRNINYLCRCVKKTQEWHGNDQRQRKSVNPEIENFEKNGYDPHRSELHSINIRVFTIFIKKKFKGMSSLSA